MQKVFKIPVTIVVFIFVAATLAMSASAAAGGFSISPVLPENQNPATRGYFDLLVTPGQKQDLVVKVNNTSDTDIVVSVEAITASTNRNGIINYTAAGPVDETLKYSFSDMAAVSEKMLTVPANSSKDTVIALTVPEESFDGTVLGSIRVLKELSEEEKSAGGTIVNRYSYVLAVRLRENDTEIPAQFLLGDVTAQLVNHRSSIVANVRNPQPRISKGVEASAQIYPKGSDTAIFELTKDKVDFAPNSVFPFSLIDEAGYGIRGGIYVAKIQLTYQDQTWDFEQEFEIKPEEAATINQNAVNQTQQQTAADALSGLPSWAVIAALSVASLILLTAVFLLVRARSRQKDYAISAQLKALEQSLRSSQGLPKPQEQQEQPQESQETQEQQDSQEQQEQPREPQEIQEQQDFQEQQPDQAQLLKMMQKMDQAELARLMQQMQQQKSEDKPD